MAGTVVASTINNDTGLFATNNAYLGIAKAWVNFTGATPTILTSFNVSSITRLAQGSYTVSFTTAMANANYVVAGAGCNAAQALSGLIYPNTTPTTSSFNGIFTQYNNSYQDPTFGGYVVFGS